MLKVDVSSKVTSVYNVVLIWVQWWMLLLWDLIIMDILNYCC